MEQDKHTVYTYTKLPENIRQIGTWSGQKRIYFEDYVMTYLRRIFLDEKENTIVVFVGKEGTAEAKECLFIYGAVAVIVSELEKELHTDWWTTVESEVATHFPDGHILGWGMGVCRWHAQIEAWVRAVQEKWFSKVGEFLFLSDLGEKEEKVFLCHGQALEECTSFYIYYEKNPCMQDYMLDTQKSESMEETYTDPVTASIRASIQEKNEKKGEKFSASYALCALLFLLLCVGSYLTSRNQDKIQTLEETIALLSDGEKNEVAKGEEIVVAQLEESVAVAKAATTVAVTEAKAATGAAVVTALPAYTPNITLQPQEGFVPDVSVEAKTKSSTAKSKISATSDSTTTPQPVGGVARIRQSYIVREGDTLSEIVWAQYQTLAYIDKVREINAIDDSDMIYIGQCILLPEP